MMKANFDFMSKLMHFVEWKIFFFVQKSS